MDLDRLTKAIVTVAQMARMCGLSRSRFYMLVKDGIMPQPSRNPETQRPFYSREQQEQCLLVRQTNCGVNGRPVFFYGHRLATAPVSASPVKKRAGQPHAKASRAAPSDLIIEELRHGLEQLGLADVPAEKVRRVLAETHPDGHKGVLTATLLMAVFQRLRRQDSPDNVPR